MLAGDADRERAADVLKAAFAEGRLLKPEYDQRLAHVMAARTVEQLRQLLEDLPHGPGLGQPPAVPPSLTPYAARPPAPYRPAPPRPVNAAATGALVCALLTPMTFGLSGIPAVILGTRARAEIRQTGERGEGAAVAGVAVGWLALSVMSMILLIVLVTAGR